MGRNAVMRKALGATVEDECRLGVHKIANVSGGQRWRTGQASDAGADARGSNRNSRATSDFFSPTRHQRSLPSGSSRSRSPTLHGAAMSSPRPSHFLPVRPVALLELRTARLTLQHRPHSPRRGPRTALP